MSRVLSRKLALRLLKSEVPALESSTAASFTTTTMWVKQSATAHKINPADVQLNRIDLNHFPPQNEEARLAWLYGRSFGMNTEATQEFMDVMLTDSMHEQLQKSENQLRSQTPISAEQYPSRMREQIDHKKDEAAAAKQPPPISAFPRTIEEAEKLHGSSHAMVITTSGYPFEVYDVNDAWEDMCGYSALEAYGRGIGELLKGPDTDSVAASALVRPLLELPEDDYTDTDTATTVTTTLTNYTKDGRRFRNQVQIGPLKNDDGKVTHYVGILREIHDGL